MQERLTKRICPECGQPLRVIGDGVAIDGRPRWQCEGNECHEFAPADSPGWFGGTLIHDSAAGESDD